MRVQDRIEVVRVRIKGELNKVGGGGEKRRTLDHSNSNSNF
jgi:hypothetical protein